MRFTRFVKRCSAGPQSRDGEKITKTGAAKLTEEWSESSPQKPALRPQWERSSPRAVQCISWTVPSGPNASVPRDVLENQVTIQSLELKVKETSNREFEITSWHRGTWPKVDNLLNEIKELDSKFHLLEVQLTTKIEACVALEKIVEELKKEKLDLNEKLASFSCHNQREESSGGLTPSLEMVTSKLPTWRYWRWCSQGDWQLEREMSPGGKWTTEDSIWER